MPYPNKPSYQSIRNILISDALAQMADYDIWFKYLDIQALTNDALLGDVFNQNIFLTHSQPSGTFLYTIPHPVNLKDIWVKNAVAGYNTTVVAYGTLMTIKELQDGGFI